MLRGFLSGASSSWVRSAEHGILRVVSLVFSMASAYAIRLFFEPLDVADGGERFITWGIAIGFGVLGYVVSRGLVHRMMNKESIWAYAPICFLVELVDVSCNYVLAASVVGQAWWLRAVPDNQRIVLTGITYVVLSVIPLVSLFLAVVDMDLERSKYGGGASAAIGRPLVSPRLSSTPVKPLLAGQVKPSLATASVQTSQAASSANNTGGGNVAAANRARFWQSQGQKQQSGQVKGRSPMDSPSLNEDLSAVD